MERVNAVDWNATLSPDDCKIKSKGGGGVVIA